MAGRVPTLGYPSRTAAVLALRATGLSTKLIAERVGIAYSSVVALECSAARGKQRSTQNTTTVFPNEVRVLAAPHAARRNISINELFRRIVEHVIEDGMVDAVLDDREGP